MKNFKEHITLCFELIEEKLSIGSRDAWDTNDYRILTESIQKVTGTLLSVSTLKRLSGKVRYTSKPNTTTLNALARFVGFEDWREFLKNGSLESDIGQEEKQTIKPKHMVLFSIVAIGLFYLVYIVSSESLVDIESNDFSFRGKVVTFGLPNSVVFNYDVSAAPKEAKIEIQQDWDERKRVAIKREDSISTSIYYWPGYFNAKLVVDDTIVQEQPILIPTLDWLGTIETDSLPIYLDREDYQSENGINIKSETLKKYDVDPRVARTIVGFYNVRDFGELNTDDFEFTTSLRNELKSGKSMCRGVQLMIMHEDGPIIIMLSAKGCISDLSLYAFDKSIDGKKTDLTGFGVDFANYVEVKCVSKNRKLDILVDKELVFSFEVSESPKKIIGLSIHFEGTGSIRNVEFKNNTGVVYDFEN